MDHFIEQQLSELYPEIDLTFDDLPLLPFARPSSKKATLVLDIDETLISVRRWIDEVQIGQQLHYLSSSSSSLINHESLLLPSTPSSTIETMITTTVPVRMPVPVMAKIVDINKHVTVLYNNGLFQNLHFHFEIKHPFGTLSTALDVGDRINIAGKSAVVTSIMTVDITIEMIANTKDSNNKKIIQLQTTDDQSYLKHVRYFHHHSHGSNSSINNDIMVKFLKPDLIFEDLYLVRFRPHLQEFLAGMSEKFEIILWTAALRSVYTPLMQVIHQILLDRIRFGKQKQKQKTTITGEEEEEKAEAGALKEEEEEEQLLLLWNFVLFRDNCTRRLNGSYLKDISQMGRDLHSVLMVDNIWQNFTGFESNGLPIIDFDGHCDDNQLMILFNVLAQIPTEENNPQQTVAGAVAHTVVIDVRQYLHSYAQYYAFNTTGIETMMNCVAHQQLIREKELELYVSATAAASAAMVDENNNNNNNSSTIHDNSSFLDSFLFESEIEDIEDIQLEIELENLDLTNFEQEIQSMSIHMPLPMSEFDDNDDHKTVNDSSSNKNDKTFSFFFADIEGQIDLDLDLDMDMDMDMEIDVNAIVFESDFEVSEDLQEREEEEEEEVVVVVVVKDHHHSNNNQQQQQKNRSQILTNAYDTSFDDMNDSAPNISTIII